jgi:hypothetical protein
MGRVCAKSEVRSRRRPGRAAPRLGALVTLLALVAALSACAFPSAARRSGQRLKEGWDLPEQGLGIVWTGPTSMLLAAGDLARYSWRESNPAKREPNIQWFRFYEGPMRPLDEVAILCHLERTTHIATIRSLENPMASEARYEPWHYPECIEVVSGNYELTVSYYSRETVEEGLSATTRTTESTVPSTTQWIADSGEIYVMTPVLGKPSPAPGDGPSYSVRPRTAALWDSAFKLEVRHWKAAIVRVAARGDLGLPVEDHREQWRLHEKDR